MLTSTELHQLVRDLAQTRVLSVYLDTGSTDPAMRHAWRATLANLLRDARARISGEHELDEFERAAALLEEHLAGADGVGRAPGWVSFVTAEARHYIGDLPVQPSPLVAWRDGPVVSPYLRALKQHRAVIVALVDSLSARLYRYVLREVEPMDALSATPEEAPGAERITAPATAAARTPAARGAVGAGEAQRRKQGVFQRMAGSLAERLTQLAGETNWVLIGGTPEWAQRAGERLPRHLASRTLISATLDHDASIAEIAREAERAATELRGAEGRLLVDQIVENASGPGRAAANVADVERALRARAVDVLLLSPQYIREHGGDAEDMVRSALATGADVEVASGVAAERLDQAASGIAARLRFAVDERMV